MHAWMHGCMHAWMHGCMNSPIGICCSYVCICMRTFGVHVCMSVSRGGAQTLGHHCAYTYIGTGAHMVVNLIQI